MSNIYYDPEKFGLRTIGEVEFSSGSYEFDTTVVWQDVETGALYVGDDSGCSCPCPFEGMGRDNLHPIDGLQTLLDYLDKRKAESYYYESADATEVAAECIALVNKVRDARVAR